ncbi:MAG: TIGR03905 family TSCPD domain-containing protein [Clostridia bacterium]
MEKVYNFSGTCTSNVSFCIDENDIVTNLHFRGGCNGNLKGIAMLCDGMKAEDIIKKLSGLKCGYKSTSCPDQLAKAIQKELDSRTK